MMLIEQKSGYENLEEIVQVKGVDIVALGPGNLSSEHQPNTISIHNTNVLKIE